MTQTPHAPAGVAAQPGRVGRWLADQLVEPAWRDRGVTSIGLGRPNLKWDTWRPGSGTDAAIAADLTVLAGEVTWGRPETQRCTIVHGDDGVPALFALGRPVLRAELAG